MVLFEIRVLLVARVGLELMIQDYRVLGLQVCANVSSLLLSSQRQGNRGVEREGSPRE